MRERLVIFDIDGTLCDTYEVDDQCFCDTVSEVLGVTIDASQWTQGPHITDSGLVPWIWQRQRGQAPSSREIENFTSVYERRLAEALAETPARFAPMPGARDLLAVLPERGWDIAVATGGWSRLARLKLSAAGFPASLLLACADDSCDRTEIFRIASHRAATAAGSTCARTVLVGDGVWDTHVARQLGWPMLGVGRDQRAQRLAQHGVQTIVRDFTDRDAVLRHLEQCTVPCDVVE